MEAGEMPEYVMIPRHVQEALDQIGLRSGELLVGDRELRWAAVEWFDGIDPRPLRAEDLGTSEDECLRVLERCDDDCLRLLEAVHQVHLLDEPSRVMTFDEAATVALVVAMLGDETFDGVDIGMAPIPFEPADGPVQGGRAGALDWNRTDFVWARLLGVAGRALLVIDTKFASEVSEQARGVIRIGEDSKAMSVALLDTLDAVREAEWEARGAAPSRPARRETDGDSNGRSSVDGGHLPPSLTARQVSTLLLMAEFDPSRLVSAAVVATTDGAAMSEETARLAIKALVGQGLAERPEGPRSGARLTLRGRRLAGNIVD